MPGMAEGPTEGAQPDAQYVSVGEASRLLDVHRNTVHNRIKAGRIKAHKVIEGDKEVYRIDRDSLDVGRTETLEHNKGAQRTTEGQDIAQAIAHSLEAIVHGYTLELGDIREKLGEERAKRVKAEEENQRLRAELQAVRRSWWRRFFGLE